MGKKPHKLGNEAPRLGKSGAGASISYTEGMKPPKRRKDKVDKWAYRPDPEWPERPITPYALKRKDTRHNCRGKSGIAHQWEETEWIKFQTTIYYLDKCTNCGKHGKLRIESLQSA